MFPTSFVTSVHAKVRLSIEPASHWYYVVCMEYAEVADITTYDDLTQRDALTCSRDFVSNYLTGIKMISRNESR